MHTYHCLRVNDGSRHIALLELCVGTVQPHPRIP